MMRTTLLSRSNLGPAAWRRSKSRRGLTMLETLLSIVLGITVVTAAAWGTSERMLDMKAKNAAKQLAVVSDAAETYIKDNMLAISDKVAASGATTRVTVDDLIAANLLPSDSFKLTPYGGTYDVWIRGTGSDGGLQAVVVEVDGDNPGPSRLPSIAVQSERNTGFVVHAPMPNADDDKILGAYGGWTASVAAFRPSGASAGDVMLATLLGVHNDIAGNDYLYRGAVPGRPDLNQMRTDITMTLDSGIVWKDPNTGNSVDVRLSKKAGQEGWLVFDGGNTAGNYLFTNDAGKDGVFIDADKGSITINSTLAQNTADAATAGLSDPYNLYVDGTANITGNVKIGGDLDVAGNTTLGNDGTDVTKVTGIFNVTGPTTLNGTLNVNDNAYFTKNVDITQNLDVHGDVTFDKCLDIGGGSDSAYCLNVGDGGHADAARFHDSIWVDGDVTANNGNVRAQAYFYQSDKRYKNDIQQLDPTLEKLLKIRGVSYKWKDDGRADMGVIAQNVEQVFPELVHTDDKGMKSVEYGNLIAPTIEAIRQLKQQNDDLKKKVDSLEQQEQPKDGN